MPSEQMNYNAGSGNGASQYDLIPCQTYFNEQSQPYRIYFTFEVQMLMFIHAYLSKNEVIGMLGGHIYNTNCRIPNTFELVKYIIISRIYPTESCTPNPSDRL